MSSRYKLSRSVGPTKGGRTWEDYYTEALASMSLNGLPEGSQDFDFAARRLLAFICSLSRIVWRETGHRDFILPIREAAKAAGLDPERHRMRAHRLMVRHFVERKWLRIVSRGQGRRGGAASIYTYIGDLPPKGAA